MKVFVEVTINELNKEPEVLKVYSDKNKTKAIENAKIFGNWLFEKEVEE